MTLIPCFTNFGAICLLTFEGVAKTLHHMISFHNLVLRNDVLSDLSEEMFCLWVHLPLNVKTHI